jgi:hypothetical protein
MKILSITFLLVISILTYAQSEKVYLFSYFTRNGEDGLHLAYSHDGSTFNALNNGKSFLTPDGTFHMVWTAGWTERGIGYSSLIDKKMGAVISKDLKSWGDISDKITFPDGVRHGTIFSSDVKILQNLLSNGQIR